MIEHLATLVAGIGLFFAGMSLLTDNLKRIASRRFRQAVAGWIRNRLMGFLWGTITGALTQSMAATVFVLVSMLTTGLMTVDAALPILLGANIGTSLLVFLATLNIKVVMLFVIGVAGLAVSKVRSADRQAVFGAIFGLSMLFLGIGLIQGGAVPLVEQSWMESFLRESHASYAVAFLAGAVLTFASQSKAAISILAITLAGAAVFTVEQTVMIIYGVMLGGSVVTFVLSSGLRGRARQIATYQVAFNCVGCLILVPLFYVEVLTGTPLVMRLVADLTSDIARQMACVYFLFNVTSALALFLLRPIPRLLERMSPATREEDDARPQYIYDHAIVDTESALDLVVLEQRRLIGFFTRYFDALRREPNGGSAHGALVTLRNSFKTLSEQVHEFLDELGRTNPADATYERLNHLLNNQRLIQSIEDTLYDLATTVDATGRRSSLGELASTVVEALDTTVLTLQDVLADGDEFDKRLLRTMTGDRSDVLQRIRRAYLSEGTDLDADEKVNLLKITNLCERFFWLLGNLQMEGGMRVRAESGAQ